MSPLYSDAQVSREAGKKIGIREIESSEVGTIDFENTELEVTFAAPGDENVDLRVLRRDPPTTLVWGIAFRPGGGWKSRFARYGTRSRLTIPYLSQEKYCQSFLAPSPRPRRPAGAFRRACIREDRDELFRLPGAFEIIHRGIEGQIHRVIEVAHRPADAGILLKRRPNFCWEPRKSATVFLSFSCNVGAPP
jgi:hypothetical protein